MEYKVVGNSSKVLGLLMVLNMMVHYLLLIPGILMYLDHYSVSSFGADMEINVNPFPMMFLFFAAPATITTFLFLRSRSVVAGCLGILVAWTFPIFVLVLEGPYWLFGTFSIIPAGMVIQIPFWKVEEVEPKTHTNPLPIKLSDNL